MSTSGRIISVRCGTGFDLVLDNGVEVEVYILPKSLGSRSSLACGWRLRLGSREATCRGELECPEQVWELLLDVIGRVVRELRHDDNRFEAVLDSGEKLVVETLDKDCMVCYALPRYVRVEAPSCSLAEEYAYTLSKRIIDTTIVYTDDKCYLGVLEQHLESLARLCRSGEIEEDICSLFASVIDQIPAPERAT